MHLSQGFFLFWAALAAGALNSVAGGGGFIAFPALIFTGMPPINANATNTAALWPGTVASTGAYRNALGEEARRVIVPLAASGMLGGLIGAIILLKTPQRTFMNLVPWLLLFATLLFAFSGQITAFVHRKSAAQSGGGLGKLGAALMQLIIALYIGFFGAGAGIMMMALFALMGVKNIHTLNGLKTMLASICNGVALVTFTIAGAVVWPQAVLMIVGAALGGYGGAYFAQKLRPQVVRGIAIATGASMSAYFFLR